MQSLKETLLKIVIVVGVIYIIYALYLLANGKL